MFPPSDRFNDIFQEAFYVSVPDNKQDKWKYDTKFSNWNTKRCLSFLSVLVTLSSVVVGALNINKCLQMIIKNLKACIKIR